MSGYGPLDGLTIIALAIFTILSAIISLIGSSARRQSVENGVAQAQDLCELTGIMDPGELQDTFGPPDMGRVWRSVSMKDIERHRRPLGHILSNDLFDWFSFAAAIAAVFWRHPLVLLALLTVTALQVAGWVVSMRLPR
ncbi:MAG: hypothetical protein V3V03_05160 [Hyphomonadaceae bacterium]